MVALRRQGQRKTSAIASSALARFTPDTWALIAIAGAVLLVNLPYLLGILDANPLGPRSGLASAVTPGPLPGQPTIDPNAGFISQAVSHRAALDLLHLHLPWWNPFEATGTPLAGEMQSAALFPLTLLTALSGGQLIEHVLLEFLAGIATYWLLRRLDVSRFAATAGGIAFALNGTFAWFAHATVNPVAFLPLLLLGLERAREATLEERRGGWGLMALAGALSFYAGFPEVAYLDALLALCWFAWRAVGLGGAGAPRFAAKAGLGAVVGALLCAPLLIAMVDYFNHADLWLHAHGYFSHVHLPVQAIPQLIMPYTFGPIFAFTDPKFVVFANWDNVGGYLSASLLVLALLGLASRGRPGLRLVLALWVVVMVARMYAAPAFLGDLVNLLPGLANAAVFRYASASVELAVVILAALGLDALVRAPVRRPLALAGAAALAAVGAAVLVARPLTEQLGPVYGRHPYLAVATAWAALTVGAVLLAGLLRTPRARKLLAAGVMALDAMVLFAAPEFSAPRSVQVDTAPVAYLQHHLGDGRYFTLGPLAPNYGAYYGLASLNAVDVPVPSAFQHFVNARLDSAVNPTAFVGNLGGARPLGAPSPATELRRNLAGYREAGVRYVLTPAGQALPQTAGGLRLVFRTPTTWIYHLDGAAPFIAAYGGGCTAARTSDVAARTSCRTVGLLVRRETTMPGWSATVDGRPATIHTVDGIFEGIAVPPGRHEVRFGFTPPNLAWGVVGFILGLLGLGIAGWQRRAAGPRSARRAPTVAVPPVSGAE